MKQLLVYLGLDVHKRTIALVAYIGDELVPRFQKTIPNDKTAIKKELERISRLGEIICCYEAGFCGYDLARYIESLGHSCSIAAPSLIPQRAGDKVKTDKRDAKKLATLLRAGLLSFVNIPDKDEERDRTLLRLRGQIRKDVIRCKHRILKFLQLVGVVYTGATHWTKGHRDFLGSLKLEAGDSFILSEHLTQLTYLELRLKDIDQRIEELASTPRYKDRVKALMCFRGISTLSAMTLITEVQSILRFAGPHEFMSYTGLTSSEHSSGDKIFRGGITKQGNKRLRHILIEASWHFARTSNIGPAHKKKLEGQDKEVVAMSIKSLKRLNKRFWHLAMTKDKNIAIVAVARELSGFIWGALRHVELKEAA